jgi:hypothetical protein
MSWRVQKQRTLLYLFTACFLGLIAWTTGHDSHVNGYSIPASIGLALPPLLAIVALPFLTKVSQLWLLLGVLGVGFVTIGYSLITAPVSLL